MLYTISLQSCRICLTSSLKDLKSIFNCFVNDLDYSMLYKYCTGFNINSDNQRYPTGICENCEDMLLQLYKFKKFSESCEHVLKKVFNNDRLKNGSPELLRNLSVDVEIQDTAINKVYKADITIDGKRRNLRGEEIVELYSDDGEEDEQESDVLITNGYNTDYENVIISTNISSIFENNKNSQVKIIAIEQSQQECVNNNLMSSTEQENSTNELIDDNNHIFGCNICDGTFTSMEDLASHGAVHLRDKVYKCPYCDEVFLLWINRRNHIDKEHTSIKRYQCSVCDVKFALTTEYFAHLKTHENEYHCNICDRFFANLTLLTNHVRSHSNKIVYPVCLECNKSFPKQELLNKHAQKFHGK